MGGGREVSVSRKRVWLRDMQEEEGGRDGMGGMKERVTQAIPRHIRKLSLNYSLTSPPHTELPLSLSLV